MAGVRTILALVLASITLVALMFIAGVGVSLFEPMYQAVPSAPDSLGWGSIKDTIFGTMTLAFIGLGLVVLVWWWFRPIRQDVRQDTRGPF